MRLAKRYAKKQYYTRRGNAAAEKREKIIKIIALVLVAAIAAGIAWFYLSREREEQEAVAALNERHKLTGLAYYPRKVGINDRLDAAYVPKELTYLYRIPEGTGMQLRKDAADAYTLMHDAMAADGLSVIVMDAYVSYADQVGRYNAQIAMYTAQGMSQQQASDKALETVELPGANEHQLGTAVDLSSNGKQQTLFLETDQGKWLRRHAHEYGFIFRYPADKTEETGHGAEPWHLRYVGVDAAQYMVKYDLCLEEYIALAKKESPKAVIEDQYTKKPIAVIEYVSGSDSD